MTTQNLAWLVRKGNKFWKLYIDGEIWPTCRWRIKQLSYDKFQLPSTDLISSKLSSLRCDWSQPRQTGSYVVAATNQHTVRPAAHI